MRKLQIALWISLLPIGAVAVAQQQEATPTTPSVRWVGITCPPGYAVKGSSSWTNLHQCNPWDDIPTVAKGGGDVWVAGEFQYDIRFGTKQTWKARLEEISIQIRGERDRVKMLNIPWYSVEPIAGAALARKCRRRFPSLRIIAGVWATPLAQPVPPEIDWLWGTIDISPTQGNQTGPTARALAAQALDQLVSAADGRAVAVSVPVYIGKHDRWITKAEVEDILEVVRDSQKVSMVVWSAWRSPATDRPDLFPDAETQAVVESFGREVVERTARAETHLKGGMEAQSSGKAEAELKQAVAMDPLNAEGHSALATVLKGKGANDEAIVHLRKAVALEPSRRADERRLVAQLGVRAEQLPSPRMDLVDLYENFVENPAAAFPKAARMFDKPRRGGDLDGMMQILRVVAPHAQRCRYTHVLDDMADAVSRIAQSAGDWRVLGEVHRERSKTYETLIGINWSLGTFSGQVPRALYFAEEAKKCYERVGEARAEVQALFDTLTANSKRIGPLRSPALLSALPESYQEGIQTAAEAKRRGQDAESVALAAAQFSRALRDTSLSTNQVDALLELGTSYVELRTGTALVPLVHELLARRGSEGLSKTFLDAYGEACAVGWSGRNDLLLQEYDRCLTEIAALVQKAPTGGSARLPYVMGWKLPEFGRRAEVAALAEWWLRLLWLAPPERWTPRPHYAATTLVTAETPAGLRRALFDASLQASLQEQTPQHVLSQAKESMNRCVVDPVTSPITPSVADWLVEAALRFPPNKGRAELAAEAVLLFRQARQEDTAQQVESLVQAAAGGEPSAAMECALIVTRQDVAGRRWESVASRLEPAVAAGGQTASPPFLRAAVLLAEAKSKLGRTTEAAAWARRASALVSQVTIKPGEQVQLLMKLALLAEDPAQKTQLFGQAKSAATVPGLELMQDQIIQQLAELALNTGNAEAAKKALLDLVSQQEAKRERLAYDPLLRQQWFADNLGTYRKLLNVAAQLNDGPLALWVAEKMRGRALTDQLAWRKVDMLVKLPANLRKQFEKLHQERQETYALLRKVSGLAEGEGDESDTTRGVYMPIRGVYMPIRGPLDQEQKVSAEEQERLKTRLQALGKQESALESVVREYVPAYQVAAKPVVATPDQLLKAIPKGAAVLEYSLTEDSVIGTAVGPSGQSTVKTLPLKPNELVDRVDKLRQSMFQQSDQCDSLLQRWYADLIAPFEAELKNSQQLMVVAEGVLQLLPFGAMKDAEGKYLMERYPLSYAPSLTLALSKRGEATVKPKPGTPSALVVAAPKLSSLEEETSAPEDKDRGVYIPIRGAYMPIRGVYMPIRGEDGVSDALASMAMIPLPGAKAEGEAVAKRLTGATLLSGAEATKDRLQKAAANCNVLHLATHGYADPDVPEFSGLLLAARGTGGVASTPTSTGATTEKEFDTLTAEEVYLWNLNAQLVTLSACETGLGKNVEGEGLMGLPRAFLCAGAKDVLCSLWSVSDESTAQLMEKFYDQWKSSRDTARSLQAAQQALLKNDKTKHPFYWAAFVAVQGPR